VDKVFPNIIIIITEMLIQLNTDS